MCMDPFIEMATCFILIPWEDVIQYKSILKHGLKSWRADKPFVMDNWGKSVTISSAKCQKRRYTEELVANVWSLKLSSSGSDD